MRVFVLAAVAVILAACQPAEAPEAAPAETPTASNAASVPAADEGAEAFVRGLYAGIDGDGPSALSREDVWSAATWRAMKAYEAAAPEGYNSNPLCNCQDPFEVAIRDLSVTQTGAASADAAVTITQGDAQTSMVLNLVRESAGWRIDNITREGDPDFKSDLASWTAEAQAAG